MNETQLEYGNQLIIDFTKISKIAAQNPAVIPVVVQDIDSKEVLILAYTNPEALKTTIKTKKATFWSTSRNQLWKKGQSSGNELTIEEIRINCEQNSLLYLVRINGTGACHSKNKKGQNHKSCYYRRIINNQLEPIE